MNTLPLIRLSDLPKHIPLVKVKIEKNHICVLSKRRKGEYVIPRSRCNTPDEVLGWVEHLSQKTFMDIEGLATFTLKAFELIGYCPSYRKHNVKKEQANHE